MRTYKPLIFLNILLLFTAAIPLFAVDAVVQSTKGKVEIKEPGDQWQPAASGQNLSRGTYISTGFNSRAILELGNSTLEVKALTRMQLEQIVENSDSVDTDLFLEVGKVEANVRSSKGLRNNFKLRSPVSTAAVRGTGFVFDGFTLWVTEGTVVFRNRVGQSRWVSEGKESSTDGYSAPSNAQKTLLNDQFEVVSSLSGGGGSVKSSRSLLSNYSLAILNINWE
ncbi:MAG: FecR domain-containing protein [Spirochaetia bacterium]|nr:FecR domain-containing protein [Spirochaetia bacterium]